MSAPAALLCSHCSVSLQQHERPITGDNLCSGCIALVDCEAGTTLDALLATIDYPVIVVDEQAFVITANQKACLLPGVAAGAITNRRPPGEVFVCAYAHQPGGCGGTIHCSGCAIRRTILETIHTRKGQHHVPAQLTQFPEDYRQVDLWITTEWLKNTVLLRIDKVVTSST